MKKKANGDIAWSLIAQSVTSIRLDVHRIKASMVRAKNIIDIQDDDVKERIYEEAGDLILFLPSVIEELEGKLTKANYIMSVLGEDFLRSRIPATDRQEVDETISSSSSFDDNKTIKEKVEKNLDEVAKRVTEAYLKKK